MNPGLFSIPLFFFAICPHAEEVKGVDYCHDPKVSQEWQKMVTEYPKDPIIIKLAGLREGLCLMIDRGQITHEQGTDIWEEDHQRSAIDRGNEYAKKMPKYTL